MIQTPRLRLRPWRVEDKPAFNHIINTPAMMAHFGGVASPTTIDALIDLMIEAQERDGFSMWAVEMREDRELAGICGVRHQIGYPELPVYGELEIGWRIGERWWGHGIAREAAEASIAWGWANTDFARIAAWTSIGNTRSWGLMTRLGMVRRADLDFHHPRVAANDPDGAMIVYTIDRPA